MDDTRGFFGGTFSPPFHCCNISQMVLLRAFRQEVAKILQDFQGKGFAILETERQAKGLTFSGRLIYFL